MINDVNNEQMSDFHNFLALFLTIFRIIKIFNLRQKVSQVVRNSIFIKLPILIAINQKTFKYISWTFGCNFLFISYSLYKYITGLYSESLFPT